jgi:EpsG family
LIKKRVLFLILVGVLAFLFVPDEALDSYRYYQRAEVNFIGYSPWEIIVESFNENFDFIYYVLFSLLNNYGLPYQLVTGISVAFFFYEALKFIDLNILKYNYVVQKELKLIAQTFALLSVSYIVIFAISRNLTAFVFFFIAINSYMKDKKLKSIIFLTLASFTHFGVLLYIVLFFLGYYLSDRVFKARFFKKTILLVGTVLGMIARSWITYLFGIVSLIPFFNSYEGYLKYLDILMANVFTAGLSPYDKIMFFTTGIVMLYGLYHIKVYTPPLKVAFVVYVWLMIAIGFSVMFTQRTVMFLVPFQGLITIAFFAQKNSKWSTYIFLSLIMVSFMAFIINVYSYRDLWVFSFPS